MRRSLVPALPLGRTSERDHDGSVIRRLPVGALYCDLIVCDPRRFDDGVGDPWELLGYFREKLRQSQWETDCARTAAVDLAKKLATPPANTQEPPPASADLVERVASAEYFTGDLPPAKVAAPVNVEATRGVVPAGGGGGGGGAVPVEFANPFAEGSVVPDGVRVINVTVAGGWTTPGGFETDYPLLNSAAAASGSWLVRLDVPNKTVIVTPT